MIYEIIGSRILSPFIGTSTYVWTSLIGVILAALSTGYWLGGNLADKRPDDGILAGAIFVAGGLVSVTILTKEIVLSAIASAAISTEIKSVIAVVILFAPASVALGFVTPFAVKLRMLSVDEAGKTVGRLYALSTAGSIVGTFAAGFFLVPHVGSVRTLYIIAGSLFAVSLLLAPFAFTSLKISILLIFALGVSASELMNYSIRRLHDLHDIDTEYSRVQVYQTTDPQTGLRIQTLSTDPYFLQSAMFLDSDETVFEYVKYYHLIRHLKPDFRRTLMIGGAGYSFPKTYIAEYPNAEIDVVEIDPQMTAIAKKFFRLHDDPRMKIIHQDGRVFLNQVETATYDAVLMDAFGSLFTVPYQLTTREAIDQINRVLKDDGVVIFNLGSAIIGPASQFLQAEFRTCQEVFPHVALFKVNPEHTDEQLQNLIIVASKSFQGLDGSSRRSAVDDDPFISSLLSRRYTALFPLNRSTLTDDLAPVEHYNSQAQNLRQPKSN